MAWQLSKGNGWRLTLLVSLVPVIGGTFKMLLENIGSTGLMLAVEPLWLAAAVLEIGILSLSFRYLTEQVAPASFDFHSG